MAKKTKAAPVQKAPKTLASRGAAQRRTRTRVETIGFSTDEARDWPIPAVQRPLRVTKKVLEIAEIIREDGGVVPGVLSFGILNGKTFLLDGQHRRAAFLISECEEGFADVRFCEFDTMAELGEEFVRLNSSIVRMMPDDVLRGLEASLEQLRAIRKKCPFVGYAGVRSGGNTPMVSMSALLRCWDTSRFDVPNNSAGTSAQAIAASLTDEDVEQATDFLGLAYKAWGHDAEYYRLWGNMNLILCMWLYRRLVITTYSPRSPRLSKELFCKCLMSLSADGTYSEWLLGRRMGERDRAPAYGRVKAIFGSRLDKELGTKTQLPQPGWSRGQKGRGAV